MVYIFVFQYFSDMNIGWIEKVLFNLNPLKGKNKMLLQ